MNTWAARLQSKLKEHGLTQEQLAKKIGVTRSAVAHYVQGTRQAPIKQIIKIASILNVDPAWLQFGTAASKNPQAQTSNRIPILNWNEVLNFNSKNYASEKEYRFLENFNHSGQECFALQIKGDAMVSPLNQLSFHPGTYIIICPNKSYQHGDFVLAASNKKEAIFRQYIEEAGSVYLKPLNPQYPLLEVDKKTKILGKVIGNIILLN